MTIKLQLPASWKTSLGGILSLFVAAAQSYQDASPLAAAQDPRVQMAVLIGIIGFLAKDYNVAGGTKPATPEAVARIAPAK